MQTLFFPVQSHVNGSAFICGLVSYFTGSDGFYIAVYDIYGQWIENVKYDALNPYRDRLWAALECVCIVRHDQKFYN